jgi:hypothetical protein
MTAEDQHGTPEIEEGSWAYLSTGPAEDAAGRLLLEELMEACAESGWKAVTHPPAERAGRTTDPGRFFASVSQAVEHADVVVAVIGMSSEISDAELTLAYSHRRPVVAVQVGEAPPDSAATKLLHEYERARIVVCDTPGQCRVSLQQAFADPAFAETIRQAA